MVLADHRPSYPTSEGLRPYGTFEPHQRDTGARLRCSVSWWMGRPAPRCVAARCLGDRAGACNPPAATGGLAAMASACARAAGRPRAPWLDTSAAGLERVQRSKQEGREPAASDIVDGVPVSGRAAGAPGVLSATRSRNCAEFDLGQPALARSDRDRAVSTPTGMAPPWWPMPCGLDAMGSKAAAQARSPRPVARKAAPPEGMRRLDGAGLGRKNRASLAEIPARHT